ncbi:MAG: hypothetical protein JWQ35_130 [Bacteriovoracaceae bacterium]|nr:hypothetical protein [Bacteriovoracaceae bacterium]
MNFKYLADPLFFPTLNIWYGICIFYTCDKAFEFARHSLQYFKARISCIAVLANFPKPCVFETQQQPESCEGNGRQLFYRYANNL